VSASETDSPGAGNGAILFPGQGSQTLGMGLDLVAEDAAAAGWFDLASDAIDLDLRAILAGDERADLDRTDVCQPAILATSMAAISAFEARGLLKVDRVSAVAGLSLGEYTALTWAGAIKGQDALKLVRLRGEAMQAASSERPSGMLSLVGATPQSAAALCEAARGDGVLVVANLLAPGQVAIAGTMDALERVPALLKEHGIRKAIPLSVAGAFHSPCMESASASLADALDATTIEPPRVPVVMNVSAEATTDPDTIRTSLKRQVTAPVLWQASMEALFDVGCSAFIEPAPGRQLTNMLKRYDREWTAATCGTLDDLHSATTWPGGDP